MSINFLLHNLLYLFLIIFISFNFKKQYFIVYAVWKQVFHLEMPYEYLSMLLSVF